MTSQRDVEDFARWLYVRDLAPAVDPQLGTRTLRIPDNYLNEAAIFLAGPLGQRLQHGDRNHEQQLQAKVDATWKAGQ
jgi:hypothetical protein